jgi:hypothetical protein
MNESVIALIVPIDRDGNPRLVFLRDEIEMNCRK